MIEAMEQQIVAAINSRWTKDKDLRKDLDVNKISENFRVICSSRNSTLRILNDISNNGLSDLSLSKLIDNLNWIYNWITEESIQSLFKKYSSPVKDKKKEAEYLNEIPTIKIFLFNFKEELIKITINKLFEFHNIKEEL